MLLTFGASENTIGYAVDYMVLCYAVRNDAVQMTLGMNMFITAQGFSKTSMLTVTIGAVCNIILDPLFIFGLGMGVKGAALATIISQAVSCGWVLAFLTGKPSYGSKRVFKAGSVYRFSVSCAGTFHSCDAVQ